MTGVVFVLSTAAALPGCSAPERRPARSQAAPTPPPGESDSVRAGRLGAMIPLLAPLHKPLAKPKPGEWLAEHPEPGQTFAEYLESDPPVPTAQRTTLYILPLGDFTPRQDEIVRATNRFLALFFRMPAKALDRLPASVIPRAATRPRFGVTQIHTAYLLDTLLPPRLPDDAAALLCLTAADLYPQDSWNFVFGQASLSRRVGVWSLHRLASPDASPDAFRTPLLRMLKIASHETAHMFGLRHCTAWRCGMNGSNSLPETDGAPLDFCPECAAKLCWALHADPVERYRDMETFLRANGLAPQADACRDALAALRKPASRPNSPP